MGKESVSWVCRCQTRVDLKRNERVDENPILTRNKTTFCVHLCQW